MYGRFHRGNRSYCGLPVRKGDGRHKQTMHEIGGSSLPMAEPRKRPSIQPSLVEEDELVEFMMPSFEWWMNWFENVIGLATLQSNLLVYCQAEETQQHLDRQPSPTHENSIIDAEYSPPRYQQSLAKLSITRLPTKRKLHDKSSLSTSQENSMRRISINSRLVRGVHHLQRTQKEPTQRQIKTDMLVELQLNAFCQQQNPIDVFQEDVYREMVRLRTERTKLANISYDPGQVKKGKQQESTFEYNGRPLPLAAGNIARKKRPTLEMQVICQDRQSVRMNYSKTLQKIEKQKNPKDNSDVMEFERLQTEQLILKHTLTQAVDEAIHRAIQLRLIKDPNVKPNQYQQCGPTNTHHRPRRIAMLSSRPQ